MPRKKKTSATLDRIGAALKALPAGRRAALEREMLVLERRASYGGLKRGPKPKLGATMTKAVLVKCTPDLLAEMAAGAKRLGLATIPEYLRELHRQHAERSQ